MGKRRTVGTLFQHHHLSSSQEDILHLWSLVILRKGKNKTTRVVQKTSSQEVILSQRLRKYSQKKKAARPKVKNNKLTRFREVHSKCSYNLRTSVISTYADTDLLYSEDVIYCKECQKHYFGVCSLHFKLVFNRQVVRDGSVKDRARLTAPWPLYISKSKIEGAGEGVWTSSHLPKGLVFGPYEGQILNIRNNFKGTDSGYAWHLRSLRKSKIYVDSVNKSISNWLRYVNCARNCSEMNLEAFQYKKDIYYITLCEIHSNTELLVWYGDEYGKELGISSLTNNILSMFPAQGIQHTTKSETVSESFQEEAKIGSRVTTKLSKPQPKFSGQAVQGKDKVQLSKPQSSLQHLFLAARLEPGENHSVEVAYVGSTCSSKCDGELSDGTCKRHKVPGNKPSISGVRFSQKYNCKYNHAYCVECKKTYSGLCPKHPMTLVLDNAVTRDGSIQDRARLTLPWPLYLAESTVKGAGMGVWTSTILPQGLVFGPCEGRIIKKTGKVSGYGWEIRGRPHIEIDAEDRSVSNWVRYINCARNYIERNLIAMQIQNEIFYVTNSVIERDTELMVWYGAAYGNWLGISMEDFFKPQLKEEDLERWCSVCQVLFTSPKFLIKHQARCKQSVTRKNRKRRGQSIGKSQQKYLKVDSKQGRKFRKDTLAHEKHFGGNHTTELVDDLHSRTFSSECIRDTSDVVIMKNLSSSDYPRITSCGSLGERKDVKCPESNSIPFDVFFKPQFDVSNGKELCVDLLSDQANNQGVSQNSDNSYKAFHKETSCIDFSTDETVRFFRRPHGFVSHDRPVCPEERSSFGLNPSCVSHPQTSQICDELSFITTLSSQSSNMSLSPYSQCQEYDVLHPANMDIPVDSESSFLDSFLDHSTPFMETLDLNNENVSYSPESLLHCKEAAAYHSLSHVGTDHTSFSSNCSDPHKCHEDSWHHVQVDSQQSNTLELSPPTTCLRYANQRPEYAVNRFLEWSDKEKRRMRSDKENKFNDMKTMLSYNNIDNLSSTSNHKIFANSQSINHVTQTNNQSKKCADHTPKGIKQNKHGAGYVWSVHSPQAKHSNEHASNLMSLKTSESELTKASFRLYWKNRDRIDCNLKRPRDCHIECLGNNFVGRKCAHCQDKRNRNKKSIHIHNCCSSKIKNCHSEVNTYTHLSSNHGESTIDNSQESCTQFSCQEILNSGAIKMDNCYLRQDKHSGHLSRGCGHWNESLALHDDRILERNFSADENGREINGFKQLAELDIGGSCARSRPFLSPNKSSKVYLDSKLYLENDKNTLYECYRCGRKYASKYNLNEHQYICV